MYLLELYFANARLNQIGKFIFPCRKGTIPKWTILSLHPREREKLQLLALSIAGTRYLPHIPWLAPENGPPPEKRLPEIMLYIDF